MSGNPTTDQYAAMVRDKRATHPDSYVLAIATQFVKTITREIPDLDPRTIGEVLLHTGAGVGGLTLMLDGDGIPHEHIITMACNVLTLAGAELYSPDQETPDV